MKTITGNRQLDFQIARFTMPFANDQEVINDLRDMKLHINNLDDWYNWWSVHARDYEKKQKFAIAANYYKAAMFYLGDDS